MTNRSNLRLLWIVIGASILVRGMVLFATPDRFVADPDAYRSIATTIDRHATFGLTSPQDVPRAIAFRPPLYPWLLSWFVVDGELSRGATAGFHLALGTLTAVLVFSATRRLLDSLESDNADSGNAGDRGALPATQGRVALLAAGVTLIDPILLQQSTEIMTETLAACLAAAVIWLDARFVYSDSATPSGKPSKWPPLALGGLLALAYLCRPTFLVWALLIAALVFVRRPNRHGLVASALVIGVVGIAVAGWTMRNRQAIGHPVWATTHGGYTLLLANNESFYDYLNAGDCSHPWDASDFLNAYQHRYEGDPREAAFWSQQWNGEPNFDAAVSEFEDDRLCQESAKATIRRHPNLFLWSACVRLSRLWSPLPHEVGGRRSVAVWGVGFFYAAWMLAVFVAVIRHRSGVFGRGWWTIWLLLFTLSAVHAVYWSNLRMRAPAMPALAIVAAAAMVGRRRTA